MMRPKSHVSQILEGSNWAGALAAGALPLMAASYVVSDRPTVEVLARVVWFVTSVSYAAQLLYVRLHGSTGRSVYERFVRSSLMLAWLLVGNGVALLMASRRLGPDSWWAGLWLELGAALIFAALVDLILLSSKSASVRSRVLVSEVAADGGRTDPLIFEVRTVGEY